MPNKIYVLTHYLLLHHVLALPIESYSSSLSILPDPEHDQCDHNDDDADIQDYWWDDHVTQFPAQPSVEYRFDSNTLVLLIPK